MYLHCFLQGFPPLIWVVPAQIMDYNNLSVYPLQPPCLITLDQSTVFNMSLVQPGSLHGPQSLQQSTCSRMALATATIS